jgi:glycosyltransferase involved in cell wall biosynthesis
MRIAYITPYQGKSLRQRRPTLLNLSLAGTAKMEVIAKLLRKCSHDVEMFSQGEVVELALKYYPAFTERERFHANIPVFYSSALPVRFINGFWQGNHLLSLFKTRHRAKPFDAVIIYNLKVPQIICSEFTIKKLKLPVVMEYEDDAFLDIDGQPNSSLRAACIRRAKKILGAVSGGMACSPHLLDQLPAGKPKLLLRGVVGEEIIRASVEAGKKNWILFSGTHYRTKGIAPLIKAWPRAKLAGWELHITGQGEETETLKKLATNNPEIIFHGLVSTAELARLMSLAKICINPHELSRRPGNVFAFKIVEYLAAGAHVISTPMGFLEKEIESGMTYMPDNSPETIAKTLREVAFTEKWRQTSSAAVQKVYGPDAVLNSLDNLLVEAVRQAIPRSNTIKHSFNKVVE